MTAYTLLLLLSLIVGTTGSSISIGNMANMVDYWESRIEGGSLYKLSEETPFTSIDDFQNRCADIGGYLAEIDTEEEYNEIKHFLTPIDTEGRQAVLLGASDAASEGQWVFMRSGQPVTFFDWYSNYGNRGTVESCMYLVWNSNEAGMHDWKCQDSGKLRRYLCEQPLVTVAAMPSYVSKGCFNDAGGNDQLYVGDMTIEDNTPSKCVAHCISLGQRYAAVTTGSWCSCGQSYGKYGEVPMSDCDMQCPQDASQTCGGWGKDHVFDTRPDSGPDYLSPGCFNDAAGNTQLYVGDGQLEDNTPATCMERCRSLGQRYAAVTVGSWCSCGQAYGKYGARPMSDCRMTCAGDDSLELCGGKGTDLVFDTQPSSID